MKTKIFGLMIAVVLLLSGMVATDMIVIDANGMMQGGCMMQGKGMMGDNGGGRMSMVRHRYVMRNGIDPAYADMSNPLESTDDVLESGRRLYENNCMSCHGSSGRGDGPAGEALDPKPTNVAAFSSKPMASDEYLYWTIAEGGEPLNTAMPAFKHVLEEDEIWRIIVYLRRGL